LQPPSTQSQPCYSDSAIFTSVKFRALAAWNCFGSEWGCSLKEREAGVALAQILGVSPQAIRVAFKESDASGVSIILLCSGIINSWHNASSVDLKYVNATALLAGLKSASAAALGEDSVLSVFDWTTLAVTAAPPAVTVTVTSFIDSRCTNRTSQNPVVFNNLSCSLITFDPSIGQIYYKAISCGAKVTYQLSLNPDRCNAVVIKQEDAGNCTATNDPATWLMYTCATQPVPPVAPAPPPDSSTTSNASLAIIVGCSVGGFVSGKCFVPLFNWAISLGFHNMTAASALRVGFMRDALACK
jgi:hypothetical protein